MSVVKQVLDIRRYQQYIKPHQQRIKADAGSLVRDDRAKEFFDVLKQIGIYDSCKLAISPDFGIKTRVSGSNTFVTKSYSLKVPTPQYGPELVVNGGFDTSDGWSLTKGITISGGNAVINSAPSGNYFFTDPALVTGKKYKVIYTVSNYVSGAIIPVVGFTSGSVRYTNGIYSEYIVCGAGSTLKFTVIGITTLDIDNVSVVEVLNSLDGSPTDATQTTSTSQPHLGNIIAPNERPSFKNQNGQSNYLTHPTISFAANEAWSVTTVLNWNGDNVRTDNYAGQSSSGDLRIKSENYNTFHIITNTPVSYNTGINSIPYIGKNTVVAWVASGDGSIKLYLNGILRNSGFISGTYTPMTLAKIFEGRDITENRLFKGNILSHIIHSQALTPTQVAQLSNYLMAKYPEIPSVTIGGKEIATSNLDVVASSNGTIIADGYVQATWASDVAAYWCFHTDSATGVIYGKLYNKKGRDVVVANPPSGWHVATKDELTSLAANGGNALKKDGTLYWATTGGTNITGFSAIGGASRNADGTFNTLKNTATFWCADSDEVLLLNHNDNTAIIVATTSAQGHSIRLVKN